MKAGQNNDCKIKVIKEQTNDFEIRIIIQSKICIIETLKNIACETSGFKIKTN